MLKVSLFGDSILKGIQIHPESGRYYVDNQIDIPMLSRLFGMEISNYSRLGCTVSKGRELLDKALSSKVPMDAIVMDYGGNDCDYHWAEIAKAPDAEHIPNTPMKEFYQRYSDIVDRLISLGIMPILTTLPPLDANLFFQWFCKDLSKERVLAWLGDVSKIYTHQESYSKVVEQIAMEKKIPLIDMRRYFLRESEVSSLLCVDGTHPNTLGQSKITSAFYDYASMLPSGMLSSGVLTI